MPKVCNKSYRWQVLCIPKYAIKAASGRFYVYFIDFIFFVSIMVLYIINA